MMNSIIDVIANVTIGSEISELKSDIDNQIIIPVLSTKGQTNDLAISFDNNVAKAITPDSPIYTWNFSVFNVNKLHVSIKNTYPVLGYKINSNGDFNVIAISLNDDSNYGKLIKFNGNGYTFATSPILSEKIDKNNLFVTNEGNGIFILSDNINSETIDISGQTLATIDNYAIGLMTAKYFTTETVLANVFYDTYSKGIDYLATVTPHTNNITWLAIGDSITYGIGNDGVSYANIIADKRNINLIKEGHSGWSIEGLMQHFGEYDTNSKADIITLFAGTNDWNSNRIIGNKGDVYSSDTRTLWAVLSWALSYLQNKYKTKPIIMVNMLYRDYNGSESGTITGTVNANGNSIDNYNTAISEICHNFNVPVIDINNLSGIGKVNLTSMTTDGVHPNAIGYERIASVIYNEISRYFI